MMSRMLVICHILNIHSLEFLNEVENFEYNQATMNPIGVGEHYESWKGGNAPPLAILADLVQ